MNEPLFPSSEEISRRIEIAKQLRSAFIRQTFRRAKRRFAVQTRANRSAEASAAARALIAVTFWLGIYSRGR
jgi:hypothetical protein